MSQEVEVQQAEVATEEQQSEYGIFNQQEQEKKQEEAAVPAAEDSKKSEFEERARLERELREREIELKQVQEKLGSLDELKSKRPRDVLRELGISPLDVAEDILKSEEDTAEEPEDEVVTLKKQLETLHNEVMGWKAKEAETAQVSQINSLISEQDTPWLYAFKEGGEQVAKDVLQVAVRRYQESDGKVVPDYSELVKEIENAVKTKYEPLVSRFVPKQQQNGQQDKKQPAKTLTNNMASVPVPVNVEDMTDMDREDRFLKLMRESGWSDGQ